MSDTTTAPQTWRDYAERLTPEQVERIETGERNPAYSMPSTSSTRRGYFIDHNEARAKYAHVPCPPDAIEEPTVWLWDGDGNDGENYSRVFVSFRRRRVEGRYRP